MHALIPELNRIVLEMAPAHIARPEAPSTFAELMRAGVNPLPVWDGASDATIYGDARVNHAARAWHDSAHVRGLFDWTPEGEAQACELQCRDILLCYPQAPKLWLDTLRAEVNGQVQFFTTTGVFPSDQKALVVEILRSNGHTI